MGTGPRYSVPFKRKRLGKTDYKKRLALLKSDKPRLVVRKTNKRVIVQLIEFIPKGDKTLLMVDNKSLNKYGYTNSSNNIPSSYLTGYLAGKLSLSKGVEEAVLDIGLNINSKGNKLYAVLKGAVDAGLKIPHNEKVLPSDDRVKGSHIKGFDKGMVKKIVEKIDKKVKL